MENTVRRFEVQLKGAFTNETSSLLSQHSIRVVAQTGWGSEGEGDSIYVETSLNFNENDFLKIDHIEKWREVFSKQFLIWLTRSVEDVHKKYLQDNGGKLLQTHADGLLLIVETPLGYDEEILKAIPDFDMFGQFAI